MKKLYLDVLFSMFSVFAVGCGAGVGRPAQLAHVGQASTHQESWTFTTIDFPDSPVTLVLDINPAGDALVGEYRITGRPERHGFKYMVDGGTFATIDFPGSVQTDCHGITDSDDIVGNYQTGDGRDHAYLLNSDGFMSFDFPGADETSAQAIDACGNIVGSYCDGAIDPCPHEGNRGFLRSRGGQFSPIDFPGADLTQARKISGQTIVGSHEDATGLFHGFLMRNGIFDPPIDVPGAAGTLITGINARGDMVGAQCPDMPCDFLPIVGWHGFLLSEGDFTLFDFPGATFTRPYGISSRGDIVGSFRDSDGRNHGFLIHREKDGTTTKTEQADETRVE